MEINRWIKAARNHAGLTQTQLGDPLGVTKGNVSAWEIGRHEPSFDQLKKIAEITSYPEPLPGMAAYQEINTASGPAMHAPVPLISWVKAGDWCGIVDNFAPGDADEWLPVPRAHGPNAYALRVRGVSMEPRYRDGSIIFVDPGKQADHGSNVVVRMDNESEATFKQLVIEGETKFLRALNPDWPGPKLIEINSNATICGVVIGQFIAD